MASAKMAGRLLRIAADGPLTALACRARQSAWMSSAPAPFVLATGALSKRAGNSSSAQSFWSNFRQQRQCGSPGARAWTDVSPKERDAWSHLGWTADSWEGRAPAPRCALKSWEDLDSSEKAIATHGLGFTAKTWDAALESKLSADAHALAVEAGRKSSEVAQTSGASSQLSVENPKDEKTGGGLLGLVKTVLPFVGTAAKLLPKKSAARGILEAVDVVHSVAQELSESIQNRVQVNGIETILYLDDSYSMRGQNLAEASRLFFEAAKDLQSRSIRIVKFGTNKKILVARSTTFSSAAIAAAWDATSGETYMWHMILHDIFDNYKPGSGHLRVFVITDGADVLSPKPYARLEGMDPMMQDLRSKGYDIEFHILLVTGTGGQNMTRYRDLALATGGGFLHVDTRTTFGLRNTKEEELFLEGIRNSRDTRARRASAMREYEKQLRIGNATNFNWYTKLPP